MAIQNRRGADAEFDSNKALPGEFGFTTDGTRKVYACFAPGDAREMAFKDQIPVVANFTQSELQEAVNNYLTENPVQAGATKEQAEQIEKNRKAIEDIPTSDTKDNTVTFESADALDSEDNPLAWTDVELLKTGEKHSSILTKISTMFKNVRYLFKVIGMADISELSDDGTITSALTQLNSKLSDVKKIQFGTASITVDTGTANMTGVANVTFETAFSSVPKVFVTVISSAPGGSGVTEAVVTNVTASSFNILVRRESAGTNEVNWFAIA